jgi:hypothetical protein
MPNGDGRGTPLPSSLDKEPDSRYTARVVDLTTLAEEVVDDILSSLLKRKGFDGLWDEIDPDIQAEIVDDLQLLAIRRLELAGV